MMTSGTACSVLGLIEVFLDVGFAALLVLLCGLEQIAVSGGGDKVGVGAEPALEGGDVGGYDWVLAGG